MSVSDGWKNKAVKFMVCEKLKKFMTIVDEERVGLKAKCCEPGDGRKSEINSVTCEENEKGGVWDGD
jgi:hypothetical protein